MISPKYAIYVLSLQDALLGEDHCSPPLLGSVQQQAPQSWFIVCQNDGTRSSSVYDRLEQALLLLGSESGLAAQAIPIRTVRNGNACSEPQLNVGFYYCC